MAAPGLFARWMDDLAPGLKDVAGVVTQRILYRSAEERAAATASQRPRGDSMDVDFGDLQMPIEEGKR
ncbi:MAG TPA: hypothetical protein VNO30_38425 [Kofleriaceae bacterium]|nr:hypothetical protein [Kofleriaceae bacterium]